jgi:tetratricopeptide (TPR) repeat protein
VERSRYRIGRLATARFHDREPAVESVETHLRQYQVDSAYLRVISVIGIGGVGKTRLLTHLQERANELGVQIVRVSLEADASNPTVGPLKVIRNQINTQCLLFDSAVVAYWSAMGQPLQAPPRGFFSESLFVRGMETGAGAFGLTLPLSFAADTFNRIRRKTERTRFYDVSEFEAIDDLRDRPSEILARLPHYLGLDLRRRLKTKTSRIAFFYDGYERQARATISNRGEWLREFAGSLDFSVHVIASREPLCWPEEWRDALEEIVVGVLPLEHCHAMVRSEVPEAKRPVVEKIVSVSKGVPFFLKAGIDAFTTQWSSGNAVDAEDIPVSWPELIAHLFDHLTPDERVLVTALALLERFDEALFAALSREFGVSLASFPFDHLTSLFFVEQASPAREVYRIHALVHSFVRNSAQSPSLRQRTVSAAASHLSARVAAGIPPELALELLQSLLDAVGGDEIRQADMECILESGYYLYDLGFWREMRSVMNDAAGRRGDAALVSSFFSAICGRRLSGIAVAVRTLTGIQPHAGRFGKYGGLVALERAYLEELRGDYRVASQIFEAAGNAIPRFDPSSRIHVRASLYHADMMIMQGRMKEGADLLLETSELLDPSAHREWSELVRHRAHAYRFSYLTEDAEALYLRALDAAGDVPGLAAKLRTNLAETRCWDDPGCALEDVELALELNRRLGNRIEIGKADVAAAIALAMLGRVGETGPRLVAARAEFECVGYQAGLLFADVAEGIAAISAGERCAAFESLASARLRVAQLGVYGHLLTPLERACRLGGGPGSSAEFQWIEPSSLEERLDQLVYQFSGPRNP